MVVFSRGIRVLHPPGPLHSTLKQTSRDFCESAAENLLKLPRRLSAKVFDFPLGIPWEILESTQVFHKRLVDPLVLDRHVDRYRKGKRTLSTVAAHYGVTLEGAHRAAGDAAATVGVARAIAKQYSKVRVDGADLVELQVKAHTVWKDSFNAYLAKVGAARPPITEEWPNG